jgi:hypothetical protein
MKLLPCLRTDKCVLPRTSKRQSPHFSAEVRTNTEAGYSWATPHERLHDHPPPRLVLEDIEAGDFIHIPAGVPHLPANRGTETVEAVIARTDPNEQESVVVLPELDALPHLPPPG